MAGMKRKVNTPLDEQETVINILPTQISDRVEVYTTLPYELKRLWKLHEKHPQDILVVTDDKYGTTFSVPRKWVSVRKPRTVTEEQKEIARERFAKWRAEQN